MKKRGTIEIKLFYYYPVWLKGRILREHRQKKSSPTSKDDISAIPQSITCLGEDGKILVKVIKGSDLSSCDEEVKEPYCVISCADPPQKKRTTKKKEANNPYWNEYFILNVNKSTQEVIFDLYDHQKAPYDSDYHFNDREDGIETDDFLGQVVVPLAAINRDQTCRLIFPVLPKSQKSQYVTGQLTIEFTFDKDGKVIDGAIPLTSRTKIVEDIITTTTETVTETLVDGTLTNRTTSKTVTVNGDETDHISQDSESIELDNGVLETELIALEAVVNGHDKDAEKEEQRMEEVLSNPMDHVETQMELEILEAVVNQLDREEDEEKKNHKDDKDETTGVITVTQETTEKTIILTEPVVITQEETQEDVKEEEEEEKEEEEIPPTIVVPLDESPSKERLSKAEEEQTEEVEDEQAKEETIAETSTQTKKTKKTRKVFTFKKHKHAKQEEPHEGEEKKEEEKEEENVDEPEKKDELAVEPSPKPKKMKKHWSFRSKKNKEAEDEEKLNLEATEDEAAKEEPEEKIEEETEETKEEPEEKKDEEEEKPKKGKRHWGFHSKKGKGPADKEPEEPKEEAQKEETIKEEDEEEKQEEEEVDKKEETEEKAEEEEEKLKKGKKHWGFHSKKGKEPAEKAPEEHKEEEAKEEEAKEEEAKEEEEEKKDEEKKEDEAEPSPKPEKTKKVKKAWTFHGKRHKDEKPDHDKEEQKPAPVVVTNGDATDDENKENLDENPNEPSVSQASTPEPVKPRKARSFHFRHKQRPVSMIETSDNKPGMSKDLSKRHSFHEGDKPPKSGSKDQLSVLSYSPSTHSSLVIETTKKEYYHIPPVMAKRGTYEQKGNKLHIYNDHVFSAIHFSGDMPNCAVCGSALGGSLLAIGKQGYECRDCKIAVHKRCHFMTSSVCPSSSIKKMEIIVADQHEENGSS